MARTTTEFTSSSQLEELWHHYCQRQTILSNMSSMFLDVKIRKSEIQKLDLAE